MSCRGVGRSCGAEQGMQRSYDVVIIGGGVMGSSAAYWLAANPAFKGSILFFERDPTYKHATTALSLRSLPHQFSTPQNRPISLVLPPFLAPICRYLALHLLPPH